MRLPTFTSSLASVLRSLVQYRQAVGYGDRTLLTYLTHFDRYLAARGCTLPYLTREVVEDWVFSNVSLHPRSRAKRLHAMRLLGRFIAQTHPETYVPGPAWGARQSSGFRPHIYTQTEVKALLAEARRLTPIGSLRPHTYATLLGLLYCTGLRISEALALRLGDVDLETGLLSVRESKFHKSRLLPLSPGASKALWHYQEERKKRAFPRGPDAPLFVNEHRGQCAQPLVYATFLVIARRTGVRGPVGARGPRLHDFRHYAECPIMPIPGDIPVWAGRLYRHNQRLSRKTNSLSSARYRCGLIPSGEVWPRACSLGLLLPDTHSIRQGGSGLCRY